MCHINYDFGTYMIQIFNSTKFINPHKNKQLKNTVNSMESFNFKI